MELEKNLTAATKRVWDKRGANEREVMDVLDRCIQQFAGAKNWSNLSLFISTSSKANANDRSKIMAIVRAAFGDQIIYKKDAAHKTGGRITMKDNRPFNDLVLLNSYGVVAEAMQRKDNKGNVCSVGFRDADMHKKLKEQQPAPAPKNADVEKSAKHIVKYLSGLKGVKPGLILHEVEKLLKAAAATAPAVVENGEPNH